MKPYSRTARTINEGELLGGERPSRRILLADRDSLLRRRLASALITDGFEVTEAVDRIRFLDLLATTWLADRPPFHLVICASDLAGWSGLNMLTASGRTGPRLLLLRGASDDHLLEDAYGAGAAAILDRACPLPELRATVSRLLLPAA